MVEHGYTRPLISGRRTRRAERAPDEGHCCCQLCEVSRNGGTEWCPAGQPEQVKVHDFIDPTLGKVNPHGVYDLAADTGWVSVDTDHDTAAFAAETIRRWWRSTGP